MNQKQKLGYMVLGAWIMAVGIIIGQVITPDIEAQSNGVFDKIQCRELEVVDKDGKKAIVLAALDTSNNIWVIDGNEKPAISLSADKEESGISVRTPEGTGVLLHANENGGGLSVMDRNTFAIDLTTTDTINAITVHDKHGKEAVGLEATETQNHVSVRDRYGNLMILLASGKWVDGVAVYDRAGNVRGRIP